MALKIKDRVKTLAGAVKNAPANAQKQLSKSSTLANQPRNGNELIGPSPNPATNLIIADIALRTGVTLARRAVEHGLLGTQYSKGKATAILKGRTIGESVVHGVLARIALTSVPGAIIVGGALVAKTLHDRSRARKAEAEGASQLDEMAEEGLKQQA